MKKVIDQVRRAVLQQDDASPADADLLACFIARRDEVAFETVVRRHGPMVMGVCRRLLHHEHDAEDAFQATFFVLARKAGSLATRELLANWLYGVATKTALKARALATKRQTRERQAPIMPEPKPARPETWDELRQVLDLELGRLHARYRTPIILCDLEGKSQKEAAQQIGCPVGTLSGRLARGRQMLAQRITRRGIVVTSVSLTGLLSHHALANFSPLLASTTSKAALLILAGQTEAAGLISGSALNLMQGVMKSMMYAKLKVVLSLVLIAGALTASSALVSMGNPLPQARPADEEINPSGAKPTKVQNKEKAAGQERADKTKDPAQDQDKIKPGDRLVIHAARVLPDAPLDGIYLVESTGKVALGPIYGRVEIQGQTLEQAEVSILDRLKLFLREPAAVQVTCYDPSEPLAGQDPELAKRVKKLEGEVRELKAIVEKLQKK